MKQENYNMLWLQGFDTTDEQHAKDIGIAVPPELFGTPKYNDYVIETIYQENLQNFQNTLNPATGENFTLKEAEAKSNNLKSHAQVAIKKLLDGKDLT